MLKLTADERRALRARAHALSPIVSISQNGLSESVMKEIDASLNSHELIKIRVFGDERILREQYMTEICTQLEAAPVQQIGKLLVIFRPLSPELAAARAKKNSHQNRSEPRRTKRSFQA